MLSESRKGSSFISPTYEGEGKALLGSAGKKEKGGRKSSSGFLPSIRRTIFTFFNRRAR